MSSTEKFIEKQVEYLEAWARLAEVQEELRQIENELKNNSTQGETP
jgi:hypothetical protein